MKSYKKKKNIIDVPIAIICTYLIRFNMHIASSLWFYMIWMFLLSINKNRLFFGNSFLVQQINALLYEKTLHGTLKIKYE